MRLVAYTDTATAGLVRASREDRAEFIAFIADFADDADAFADSGVIKRLTGWPHHWVVKLGVFRAILRVERNQVTVVEVEHRRDAYKGKRG